MAWNIIYPLIRGVISARGDVQRSQERWARKAAARAERKVLEAEIKANEYAEYTAFWKELRTLRKMLKDRRLRIDEVEQTDAIAFYLQAATSESEAIRQYRVFLEAGGKFPGVRSDYAHGGRQFRKKYGWLTQEIKKF